MTNNIFDFKRFTNYIQCYCGINGKKLLQQALVIVGVFIVLPTLTPLLNGTYSDPDAYHYDLMWDREITLFLPIAFLIIVVNASAAFKTLETKELRINAFTFPASNLEKYLTYILLYVIAPYLLCLIGIFAGDYIRVLTASLYAHPDAFVKPLPLSYIFDYRDGELTNKGMMGILLYFGALMIFQCYFFLCSCIWPKNGIAKGMLSAIGIAVVCNFILMLSLRIFLPASNYSLRFDPEDSMSFATFYTISWVVVVLISIGTYCLTYLRFKEMETIERW